MTLKSPMIGIVDRDGYDTIPANWLPYIGGFIVNVDWDELQTNGGDSIVGSVGALRIDAALVWAAANNIPCGIRVYGGIFTPSAIKVSLGQYLVCNSNFVNGYWITGTNYTFTGTPAVGQEVVSPLDGQVYRNNKALTPSSTDPSLDPTNWVLRPKTNPQSGYLPAYWSTTNDATGRKYVDYVSDVNVKLAARYDSNPYVRDIVYFGTMAVFSEPLTRYLSGAGNPELINNNNLLACSGAGGETWTLAKEYVAVKACILATKNAWSTTCVKFAWNVYNQGKVGGGFDNKSFTLEMIRYAVETCGDQAIIGDNGFEFGFSDFANTNCAAYGGRQYFQTRSASQITNLGLTLIYAAHFGAQFVEAPHANDGSDQGYQNWDPLDAKMVTARRLLALNADKPRSPGYLRVI